MDITHEVKNETLTDREPLMETLLHQNLQNLLASSKKLPGSFPNADDPSLYMDKPSRNTNISWFWKFIKQETLEEEALLLALRCRELDFISHKFNCAKHQIFRKWSDFSKTHV